VAWSPTRGRLKKLELLALFEKREEGGDDPNKNERRQLAKYSFGEGKLKTGTTRLVDHASYGEC